MSQIKKKDFPIITDELFIKSEKFNSVNINTGITKFFLFSESYKKSANVIFEKIQKPDYERHFFIAPVIYLCRHFLELRLKELISGINYTKTGEYKFPDGHNLENLWNEYNTALTNADLSIVPRKPDLKAVKKLIEEFNKIDSTSMSFRYPVEKDKKTKSLQNLESFDIENFTFVMEKLFNFFDEQSGNLFHLIELADEYLSYLHNQMISEYFTY